jgi:hypothetical protein
MIEPDKYEYKTTDGRAVILLPQTRKMQPGNIKVWIGLIAGERSYRHWTEDGTLFGERDKKADLA